MTHDSIPMFIHEFGKWHFVLGLAWGNPKTSFINVVFYLGAGYGLMSSAFAKGFWFALDFLNFHVKDGNYTTRIYLRKIIDNKL